MDTHKNASLTPRGREAMARSVIEGGSVEGGCGARVQHDAEDGRQMGRAVPRRGRGRLAGPLVQAALIAKPDGAGRLRSGRGFAQAAPYRRADRRGGRGFGGHCQPHPQTAGPQSACRRSSRPSRSAAMNAQPPARSSTSTSKSSASSIGSATGSPATGPARAIPAGSAGNMCIWRSTTIPGSPIRKSCRTRSDGSCLRFLFNALRFFRSLGVKVERVMTDNGSSFRSHRYAKALRRLKIKHLRTRPYTPKTNGKAERFVQTSLREWAYARAYSTSEERAAELPIWLHRYNWHRPHGSIGYPARRRPRRVGICVSLPLTRAFSRSCFRLQIRR